MLMMRYFILLFVALSLISCGSSRATYREPARSLYLEQGKRYFQDGYYRRALNELLPYAADADPEAQYAVGYMYYYGYGPAQDTDVGYFWIKRSASRDYEPAIVAKSEIDKQREATLKRRLYPQPIETDSSR